MNTKNELNFDLIDLIEFIENLNLKYTTYGEDSENNQPSNKEDINPMYSIFDNLEEFEIEDDNTGESENG